MNFDDRFMKQETVITKRGTPVLVSTVELRGMPPGLDALLAATVAPNLGKAMQEVPGGTYETMVFRLDGDEPDLSTDLECRHYRTQSEAEQGHAEIVTKWTQHNEEI